MKSFQSEYGSVLVVLALLCYSATGIGLPSRNHLSKLKDIKQIVTLRSGDLTNPTGVWYHNGILRNPMTGSTIAGIEGLEMNRYIGSNSSVVDNDNATFSGAYLSKKIFVYTDLANETAASPLRRFKVQFLAPFRKVQPVKAFSEIVTLSIDSNSSVSSSIEFPNHRTVFSKKIQISSSSGEGPSQFNIVHFISGGQRKKFSDFSKWISFSKPSDSGSGRNQEYYVLTDKTKASTRRFRGSFMRGVRSFLQYPKPVEPLANIPTSDNENAVSSAAPVPLATMKYIRYGECPSWYSLHKPCTIEIDSWKYNNLEEVPAHIVPLVNSVQPSFLQHEEQASFNTLEQFAKEVDIAEYYKPWYKRGFDTLTAKLAGKEKEK